MKEASIFKAVAQEWGHLIGSLIKKKEKPSEDWNRDLSHAMVAQYKIWSAFSKCLYYSVRSKG
jgi:uncharacterized protein YukE